MDTWTVAELRQLFTGSSRSGGAIDAPNTDYEELVDLLSSGAVLVTSESYYPAPEPRRTWPPTPEREAFEQAHEPPGNRAHSLLKWWAWNWLRRQGELRPFFHFPVGNGFADVCAPSLGIVAECGDTHPHCIAEALEQDEWQSIALFPFPRRVTILALSPNCTCGGIPEYEVFLFTVVRQQLKARA